MTRQADNRPVALYARVSSDRQDVDLSVAAQLRALRTYAAQHGSVVAREYVDEAVSGRVADRPQFRRMLEAASRPDAPFQEILVWKFSRFTRKREHAVAFKFLLSKWRVALDRVEIITSFARDLSELLRSSEITESMAFIHSFVRGIRVRPDRSTFPYPIPAPENSPIGNADAAEVAHNDPVMRTGHVGGPHCPPPPLSTLTVDEVRT